MQVTEQLSEGLKRELKVVIPAGELKSRVENKLEDLKSKVRLNGFRPGKVPLERVRQMYGRSVMAEVVEETVGETSNKALQDRNERPAAQPAIKLPEDEQSVENIITGAADLEYTMSFEILPKVQLADLKEIALEKHVATPSEEDLANAIKRLLDANTPYETVDRPAQKGDRLTIDYKGSIDGEAFEGGAADDVYIVLGSAQFIPGFEDALEGLKAGEEKQIKLAFPAEYQAQHLAGKDAVFEVKVKEVAQPAEAKADDEFAKSLGLDSLEKLNEAIRGQLQKDLDKASKNRLKRHLLDALDERHAFDVPASLLEREFEGIWRNVMSQMERAQSSFEAEDTTEEKARADYLKVAERRVRLGLVLAEIGTQNELRITEDELRRAMIDRARQFPGQEREVIEFYRKNPNALNELRAPVYEEKVVNFALELVKQSEKTVTSLELMQMAAEQEREDAILEEGSGIHDHDHDHEHEHDHEHVHGPDCDHGHDH